ERTERKRGVDVPDLAARSASEGNPESLAGASGCQEATPSFLPNALWGGESGVSPGKGTDHETHAHAAPPDLFDLAATDRRRQSEPRPRCLEERHASDRHDELQGSRLLPGGRPRPEKPGDRLPVHLRLRREEGGPLQDDGLRRDLEESRSSRRAASR